MKKLWAARFLSPQVSVLFLSFFHKLLGILSPKRRYSPAKDFWPINVIERSRRTSNIGQRAVRFFHKPCLIRPCLLESDRHLLLNLLCIALMRMWPLRLLSFVVRALSLLLLVSVKSGMVFWVKACLLVRNLFLPLSRPLSIYRSGKKGSSQDGLNIYYLATSLSPHQTEKIKES